MNKRKYKNKHSLSLAFLLFISIILSSIKVSLQETSSLICDGSCETCQNKFDECIICAQDYYKIYNGGDKCVKDTPENHFLDNSEVPPVFKLFPYAAGCLSTSAVSVDPAIKYSTSFTNKCLNNYKIIKTKKIIYSSDGSGLTYLQAVITADTLEIQNDPIQAFYNNETKKEFVLESDENITKLEVYNNDEWITAVKITTNKRNEILGDVLENDISTTILDFHGEIVGFSGKVYVNGISQLGFEYLITCHIECYECTKNPAECISCKKNFYFKTDEPGKCLSQAPAGYFISNNLSIDKCDDSCELCMTEKTNCKQCASEYYPFGNSFPTKCYKKPTSNTQYENMFFDDSPSVEYFKPCNAACKYCSKELNICLQCSDNYYLVENTSYPEACFSSSTHPSGYFLDQTANIIKKCDVSCATCNGTSKYCSTCANSYYHKVNDPNTCYNTPPDGFYLDKKATPKVYKYCDNSCSSCHLRPMNCVQCSANYFPKLGVNSVCYDEDSKIDGFYLKKTGNSPYSFQACNPSCKSCSTDGAKCTECADGFYFIENLIGLDRCYNGLPNGDYYFDDKEKLYKKCGKNCATCDIGGDQYCDSCANGTYFTEDTFVNNKGPCLDVNPGSKYYLSGDIFKRCHQSCASCLSGQDDGCTSCSTNLYPILSLSSNVSFKCYAKVSDLPSQNYYLFNNYFLECDNSCATCNDPTSCTKCKEGYYYLESDLGGICYSSNKKPLVNTYFDSINSLFKSCYYKCLTCDEYGEDKCTSCDTNNNYYFAEIDDFKWPVGFDFLHDEDPVFPLKLPYPNVGPCISTLQAKSSGFSPDPISNKYFRHCKPNCAICQAGLFLDDCSKCNDNYKKKIDFDLVDDDTCYKSPPENYYIDPEKNDFLQKCNATCKTCNGPWENSCTTCNNNYYMKKSASLPTQCYHEISGYYLTDGVFDMCDNSCLNCLNSATSCTACNSQEGFYPRVEDLNKSTKTCYDSINPMENYFISNQLFIPCETNCKFCNQQADNMCSECSQNYYPIDTEFTKYKSSLLLNDPNKISFFKCHNVLPAKNYWFDDINKLYKACADNCYECLNGADDACVSCAENFYFKINPNKLGDKCYNKLNPPALNYFLKDNFFQECDPSCKKCNDSTANSCLECADDYFFKNNYNVGPNKCYFKNNAPAVNYILINGLFYECSQNCATCTDITNDKCLSCADKNYFKEGYNTAGDICYSIPPDDYYLAADGLYKLCDKSCDECLENSTKCISCNYADSYYPMLMIDDILSNECYNSKPQPNFFLDTDVWKKCSDNCSSCNVFGPKKCLSCAQNYFAKIDDNTGEHECFSTTPSKYYFSDSLYRPCTKGCLGCKTDGISNCYSCDTTEGFYTLQNVNYVDGSTCYNSPPVDNVYLNLISNQYDYCHATCKKCKGPAENQCTECVNNFYFRFDKNTINGDKCFNTLPEQNMFLDSDNIYKYCHQSCSKCDKAGDKCLACADLSYFKFGYNILGDICYAILPETNYYLDKSNPAEYIYKQCSENCATCDEFGVNKCKSCVSKYYFIHGVSMPNQCYNDLTNKNYYLDLASNTYNECHLTCAKCSGSEENKCLECVGSYFFKAGEPTPNVCYTALESKGYYLANNLWEKCASNCNTCQNGSDSGCINCPDEYYFKENDTALPNKCYNSLPNNNYYLNTLEKLYKLCSPLCFSCSSFGIDKCDMCLSTSYNRFDVLIPPFECYNTKPESDFYLDTSIQDKHIYKKCDASCLTCDLAANLCTSCNIGFYFKEGYNVLGDICHNTLPDTNFFLDLTKKLYRQCDPACKTCSGESNNNCTVCNTNYYPSVLDTVAPMPCYNKIPFSNYYLDLTSTSTQQMYKSCHPTCATCRASGTSKCDTCIDNYYFMFGYVGNGNKCFNVKPYVNYYLDKTENIWKPCSVNCATCKDSKDKCLTCNVGLYFKENYDALNGDYCYEDFPAENYYLDETNNLYKKCDISCKNCSGAGQNACNACANNYYQIDGQIGPNQRCYLASDLPSYFVDKTTMTFKQCISPCTSCTAADNNKCLACKEGNHLKENFDNVNGDICYLTSPADNYYLDLSTSPSYYKQCSPNCSKCYAGGENKCKACVNNFIFKENYDAVNGDTCHSITSVIEGYYLDEVNNIFKKCSATCKNCESAGSHKCTECQSNLYFKFNHAAADICYSAAPASNYYLDQSQTNAKLWVYKPCDSTCETCAYKEACEACATGKANSCLTCPVDRAFIDTHSSSGDFCYSKTSPPGVNYILDSSLIPNVFKKCSDNCLTCDSVGIQECLSCPADAHFISGYDKINGARCYYSTEVVVGYYLDNQTVQDQNSNNKYLQPCGQRCKYCVSNIDGKCTECFSNFHFKENFSSSSVGDKCYASNDPEVSNFYLDPLSNLYKSCDASCVNCVTSTKNCLACNTSNGFYPLKNFSSISSNGFECYQSLSGYYLQTETISGEQIKHFDKCLPNCASCNAYDKCLTCVENSTYFKQGFDVLGDICYKESEIQNGFYLDTSNKLFMPCNSSCASCDNSSFCLSCPAGTYLYIPKEASPLVKYGQCLSIAPYPNYYKDEVTRKFLICDVSCATCNGPANNNCLTCPEKSYFLINYNSSGDTCYSTTPDYHYFDTNIYKQCYFSCQTCSGPESDKCTQCRTGFHFKSTPGVLEGSCESDTPILSRQQVVKYLISNNNAIVAGISTGSETSNSGSDCSFNCLKCTGYGDNKCLECNSGFYFIENYNKINGDVCYSDKPYKNYYLDTETKLYKQCSENCKTCATKDSCLSCQSGFYFKENYNQITGDICYSEAESSSNKSLVNYFLDQAEKLYKFCNYNSGSQYLQYNPFKNSLECKSLKMIDLSPYTKIEIPNVKVATSKRYTMQFWFNLISYGYNPNKYTDYVIPFGSEEFIWDLHLKIKIENIKNQIQVSCYPLYDEDSWETFESFKKFEILSNPIGNWIKVSCSVDQNKKLFRMNNNNKEYYLNVENISYPDLLSVRDTELIIKPGKEVDLANNNYGLLFVKELKLWTYYDAGNFDSDCKIEILNGNGRFTNLNYLKQLAFYFKNDQYSLHLDDASIDLNPSYTNKNKNSNYYYLENSKNKNFLGYQNFNETNVELLTHYQDLDNCMNLMISPNAGILGETTFTIEILKDFDSKNFKNYLYYTYMDYNGELKTVYVASQTNPIKVKTKFNIQLNESLKSSNKPIKVQVYSHTINSSGKNVILYEEILLYNSQSSLDFNNLIEAILNNYQDIDKLTSEDKENLSNVLNKLNAYNEMNKIQLSEKFSESIANDKGELEYLKASCLDNYCYSNGECIIIEEKSYCYCYEGFTGKRCQFTEKNQILLKNYFKNITNTLVNQATYNQQKNIKEIHNHIKYTENLMEETDDLNNYILILENLIEGTGGNLNKAKENVNLIFSIINSIISLTEQNIIKAEIDNYEFKSNKGLASDIAKRETTQFSTIYTYKDHSHNILGENLKDPKNKNKKFRYLAELNNTKFNTNYTQYYNSTIFNSSSNTNFASYHNSSFIANIYSNKDLNNTSNSNNTSYYYNSTNIYNNTNYVDNNNKTIYQFFLENLQIQKFKSELKKIKSSIFSFILSMLNNNITNHGNNDYGNITSSSTNNSALNSDTESGLIKITNDNFDVIAKTLSLDELILFDKERFFIDRIIHKKSYFDIRIISNQYDDIYSKNNETAKQALLGIKYLIINNFKKNNTPSCLDNIKMVYLYNKNPLVNLDYSITKYSLTSSHIVEFFDCELNRLDLENLFGKNNLQITHYLPIISRNKEFIQAFNLNPRKYLSANQHIFRNTYPPYYIFPNGTVDKNPDIAYQIEKYHKNFEIKAISYSMFNNSNLNPIANQTFVNETYTSINNRYLTKAGYVIATTPNTGEVYSYTFKQVPSEQEGSLFFLHYPELLTNKYHLLNSLCIYSIFGLFFLNIIFVILEFIFRKPSGCCNKKSSNVNLSLKELFEAEKMRLLSDEMIFRLNYTNEFKRTGYVSRYSCLDLNLEKNILPDNSKNITNNIINNGTMGKIFENAKASSSEFTNNQAKGNNRNNTVNNDPIEIELHISNEIDDGKNIFENDFKTEKNNYRVLQNFAACKNISSLEDEDRMKNANYKKQEETVAKGEDESKNICPVNNSQENKNNNYVPHNVFKNKSIKNSHRAQNDNIPAPSDEVEKEMGLTEITYKNCFYAKIKSLFHFTFIRNIYSNHLLMSSIFNPRHKSITRIFTLLYLLIGSTCLLYGNSNIDFKANKYFDIKVMAYTISLAILIANSIFALLNILYSSFFLNTKKIQNIIDHDFSKDKIKSIQKLNNFKFLFLTLVNFVLLGFIAYFIYLFEIIWSNWSRQLVGVCLSVIIYDFIFMEFILEIIIVLLLKTKLFGCSTYFAKILLTIKYLRNMN